MPVLQYFPIRGRGEPIRYLLHDNGVEFEDEAVCDWPTRKPAAIECGDCAYGQLPAFQDDGLKLVQSNAILRHLARKHNLYGSTLAENAKVDMYLDGAEDWRMLYLRLIYADSLADEAKATFAQNSKGPIGTRGGGFVQAFEKVLKANGGDYLVGENITVADYSAFDIVDVVLRIVPDLLDDAPALKAWHERILARPGIAAYIASNPAHRAQVNGNTLG